MVKLAHVSKEKAFDTGFSQRSKLVNVLSDMIFSSLQSFLTKLSKTSKKLLRSLMNSLKKQIKKSKKVFSSFRSRFFGDEAFDLFEHA